MAHSHIAIVGDGVSSLILLAVLRQAGVARGAVSIYGDNAHPLANLQKYATSVHQETMRSEGDGHLHPRNFPDLTWQEAWQNRTLTPFFLNVFNRYNPSLKLVLNHAAKVAQEFEFEAHRVRTRIGCIRRPPQRAREFDLMDINGQFVGRARHVVLALGHPGLNWPGEFEAWRADPRVVHAYEKPALRAGERVVIVGGGIGAAHLWLAALDAGSEVIALHRKPLRFQPLNAPRCAFNEAGIATYRRLRPEERLLQLANPLGSSYPKRPHWEKQFDQARKAGRFRTHLGQLSQIEPGRSKANRLLLWFNDQTAVEADRLIFATGFKTDPCGHPVIRQLVDDGAIRMIGEFLYPNDDFTLAPISQKNSLLAVIGTLSRFALPVADTFVGMKYTARRLLPLLKR
ncbi:MAG: hypothetical protein Fur0022_02880 [Anaerolineales bacterium]